MSLRVWRASPGSREILTPEFLSPGEMQEERQSRKNPRTQKSPLLPLQNRLRLTDWGTEENQELNKENWAWRYNIRMWQRGKHQACLVVIVNQSAPSSRAMDQARGVGTTN